MSTATLIPAYLGFGLAADKPATPAVAAGCCAFYYETDTPALSVWDGTAWQPVGGGGGGAFPTVFKSYAPLDVTPYQIPDDANFVGFTAATQSTPSITLPQNPTDGQRLEISVIGSGGFNPTFVLPSGYTCPAGFPGSPWAGQGSTVILQFEDSGTKVWNRIAHVQ